MPVSEDMTRSQAATSAMRSRSFMFPTNRAESSPALLYKFLRQLENRGTSRNKDGLLESAT